LLDIAYIDFSGEGTRDFLGKFEDLPENFITLIAYSASKSYTMYGLRNGALLCIAASDDLAKEFYYSCAYSNRGTWSNGTHGAMAVISRIYSDQAAYDAVEAERDHYRGLLKARGEAFLAAAAAENLVATNYKGGFFVSIPSSDPVQLSEYLIEKNLFSVPLQNGIRLAICATSEEKCARMPAIIKAAIQTLG
jgi:aromatic-amino-acid transaminase